MPLYVYGASYEAGDIYCTPGGRAVARLAGRHRMGTVTNNALGGSGTDSMAIRALGNAATKWVSGTKALVYVDPAANSFFWGGFTTALAQAAIVNNIHALFAAFASASRVESAAATKTGAGWTQSANAAWSGGNVAVTPTTGDTIDYTVTVNATGIVDVIMAGVDPAYFFPGGPFTIYVDGVQYGGTYQTSGQAQDTGSTTENDGSGRYAITLTGLTPGVRVIRVKKEAQAGATNYLWSDSVLVRSLTPPPVVALKLPALDWVSIQATWGYGGHTVTAAELAAVNAALDVEAALFPNVIVVDPGRGFDYSTMVGPDFLHPNDKGMAHYCNEVEKALQAALGWRPGLHTGVS